MTAELKVVLSDKTIRTTINRLLTLAETIRTLGRSDFDMGRWIRWKAGKGHLAVKPRKMIRCKTAGCIAGWATTVHPKLRIDENGNLNFNGDCRFSKNDAFQDAFPGISFYEAYQLTRHDAPHHTPAKAAKAVERLAEEVASRNGFCIVEVE